MSLLQGMGASGKRLEGKLVVSNPENDTLKISKLGEKMPMCQRGLQIHAIQTKLPEQKLENLTIFADGLELRGNGSDGNNSVEGNVFLDGRPVCDDQWDDTDATVVCRSSLSEQVQFRAISFSCS